MRISNQELEKLANLIVLKIREEFGEKHLSGNLMNTIEIKVADGDIQVVIPAKTYNMLTYLHEGVIVHTSHGSYASKLDKTGSEFFIYPKSVEKGRKGSFKIKPHNHIGYVERVINSAIKEWLAQLQGMKGQVKDYGN